MTEKVTFPLLLNYLSKLKSKEKVQIFSLCGKNEFSKVYQLPGNLSMAFFEAMVFRLDSDEEFSMFKEKLGFIKNNPYFELKYIETIIQAKRGFCKKELADMKKNLIETKNE